MPRNKQQSAVKNTRISRTRHDSSESKTNTTPTLRKNASKDSSRGGIATPKKTSTLPRPSRIAASKTPSSGLKIPVDSKVARSRSSSRESVNTADVKGRRDSNSSAKSNDSNEGSRLGRHNPTEKSMRRRLLSGETTKIAGKSTLQRHRLQGAAKGLRGDDPTTSPRRATNLRSPGLSSLPGSNSSSPIPKMAPNKSLRTVGAQYGKPKPVDNHIVTDAPQKQEIKTPTSGLRAPKSSGLPAPKSGLKPPSSGLRKPNSGIPKPR